MEHKICFWSKKTTENKKLLCLWLQWAITCTHMERERETETDF